MNIGLIGTGAIGNFLLNKLNKEKVFPGYRITSVFDERSVEKYPSLAKQYELNVYDNLDDFLNAPIDLVIESATIEVVENYAESIIMKKDLFIISVGALADDRLLKQLKTMTNKHNTKVYLPAGAIGGLDLLQSASVLGGLREVCLTTRKPAHSLSNEVGEDETILFEGNAKEAIKLFPKNVNVAIILSLAGIGTEQTKVTIIADPSVDKNIHHIRALGDFGSFSLEIMNEPSPANPKSSYLTSLSILSSLQSLTKNVVIGR